MSIVIAPQSLLSRCASCDSLPPPRLPQAFLACLEARNYTVE